MAPGREPRLFAGAPGLGPRSPRATGLTAFGMGSQALEDDQFVVLVATHWRRAFYIEVLGIGYQFTGVGIDQHRQASGSDTVFQVKPRHRNSRVKRHP
jgi:hypothetical protein